jgi:hypothetical protein
MAIDIDFEKKAKCLFAKALNLTVHDVRQLEATKGQTQSYSVSKNRALACSSGVQCDICQ